MSKSLNSLLDNIFFIPCHNVAWVIIYYYFNYSINVLSFSRFLKSNKPFNDMLFLI